MSSDLLTSSKIIKSRPDSFAVIHRGSSVEANRGQERSSKFNTPTSLLVTRQRPNLSTLGIARPLSKLYSTVDIRPGATTTSKETVDIFYSSVINTTAS